MAAHTHKDEGKEEHSFVDGGIQTGAATMEMGMVVVGKLEIQLPQDMTIKLLGI